MIQFSHRNEKITRLFSIIFWILAGFHSTFGCIAQLVYFVIHWLNVYRIVDTDGIRLYLMALDQWIVS